MAGARADDDGAGRQRWLLSSAAAVGVIAAAGLGTGLWWRRRTRRTEKDTEKDTAAGPETVTETAAETAVEAAVDREGA
jgi:D-alanyl-D-alanine carboxypeptidase (penicillin-binding protein 5/6)